MIFYSFPFLNKNDVSIVKALALKHSFTDGRGTASGSAKERKSNTQLELDPGDTQDLHKSLLKLIFESNVLKNLVLPKRVPRMFINLYDVGSYYGWHVDSSIVNCERTDFSFTIWLSDPSEYEGGELQLKFENDSVRSFKCDAGHILLYPTGELHQVTEVKSGQRQAIVGWITSAVASDADRAILIEYQKAVAAVCAQTIPREAQDRLDKVFQLLVRRFSS